MKKLLCLLLALALLLVLGCKKTETDTSELYAMDTLMRLTAYGEGGQELNTKLGEEIRRLEALLDPADENSEVYAINASSAQVSDEILKLLNDSLTYSELTGGAFDITVRPISLAWGFQSGDYRVPGQSELDMLRGSVGSSNVNIEGNTVTLAEGAALDFGAIAKGYAATRLKDIADGGCTGALLDLGGNIQTVGSKPDGSNWRVAVADPSGGDYIGILEFSGSMAVVTSGSYQRFFSIDGAKYHHIIDPATGRPADSGLVSVTVLCADAEKADALSTALFVMGAEKGIKLCESLPDVEAVFVTSDSSIILTDGLEGCFELISSAYSLSE